MQPHRGLEVERIDFQGRVTVQVSVPWPVEIHYADENQSTKFMHTARVIDLLKRSPLLQVGTQVGWMPSVDIRAGNLRSGHRPLSVDWFFDSVQLRVMFREPVDLKGTGDVRMSWIHRQKPLPITIQAINLDDLTITIQGAYGHWTQEISLTGGFLDQSRFSEVTAEEQLSVGMAAEYLDLGLDGFRDFRQRFLSGQLRVGEAVFDMDDGDSGTRMSSPGMPPWEYSRHSLYRIVSFNHSSIILANPQRTVTFTAWRDIRRLETSSYRFGQNAEDAYVRWYGTQKLKPADLNAVPFVPSPSDIQRFGFFSDYTSIRDQLVATGTLELEGVDHYARQIVALQGYDSRIDPRTFFYQRTVNASQKSEYRNLMKVIHPDTHIFRNLSQPAKNFAEELMKRASQAAVHLE